MNITLKLSDTMVARIRRVIALDYENVPIETFILDCLEAEVSGIEGTMHLPTLEGK